MQIACFVKHTQAFLAIALCIAFTGSAAEEVCPTPVKGNQMVLNVPNGCGSYRVGDSISVTWDLDSAHDAVVISFSSNNGKRYAIIGQVASSKGNYMHGPFKWAIPDTFFSSDGLITMPTVSDSCRIKIKEYWKSDLTDLSDMGFKILPALLNVKHSGSNAKSSDAIISLHGRVVQIACDRTSQTLVSISSLSGRFVTQSSGTNMIRLSLEKNSPGVYLAKISGIDGVRVSRMVLN